MQVIYHDKMKELLLAADNFFPCLSVIYSEEHKIQSQGRHLTSPVAGSTADLNNSQHNISHIVEPKILSGGLQQGAWDEIEPADQF